MLGASSKRRLGAVLLMGRSRPPQPGGPRIRRLGIDRSLPSSAPVEVTVNLKKVVTWLVVAFVVFYVIQAPEQSALIVRNTGQALGDAASSLANFVGSLV
jgi:hypothetical protein